MVTYVVAAKLNPINNNQFTLTLWWPNPFKRDDGNPSQNGDVLSVQPDGSLQARPQGTQGVFEVLTRNGICVDYNPTGNQIITLIPTGA